MASSLDECLTEAEVERAVKREGITHPLLDLFERLTPQIQEYVRHRPGNEEIESRNTYFNQKHGFFAQAVDCLEPYQFTTTGIIAAWSKLSELETGIYENYRIVGWVVAKYAAQDLDKSVWGRVAQDLFDEEGRRGSFGKREGIEIFKGRVDEAMKTIDQINRYIGMPSANFEVEKMKAASPEGEIIRKALLKGRVYVPHHDLLTQIKENFGNGVMILRGATRY